MKRIIVISLGGSLIVPEKIDFPFLHKFKQTLRKNYSRYKFVIVCGGGVIARKYITALEKENKSNYQLSQAGIRATRMNAQFMMQFFGKEANDFLPMNMKQVKSSSERNAVVFCGALRFSKKATSDTTAAKLASYFKTKFINLTNVSGLYTSDPKKNKDAKLISKISWEEFDKLTKKHSYKPGQHFVLDQSASTLIKINKIPTYVIGPHLKNLDKILMGKKFIGTLIGG